MLTVPHFFEEAQRRHEIKGSNIMQFEGCAVEVNVSRPAILVAFRPTWQQQHRSVAANVQVTQDSIHLLYYGTKPTLPLQEAH